MLFLALAALAAALFLVAPSAAQAQEEDRPSLIERLFGSKPDYRVEDPPAEVAKPRAGRNRAERAQRKKARAERDGAERPPVAAVTKRPEARTVLVVGDFLGSGLAEGLTTAFTESADIRIVDRTNGSSGFVRDDFYDWPAEIDGLIASVRPAAVVVMIGANDRQQMLVDGNREAVRSENWNKEYAGRAGELAKAISARNVPFLWVGMPPFKSSKMMLDMLAFNEIYRAAAAGSGGEFVDIWDGFVDENGAYVSNGPDLNGQPARLRANDGINLARPGKRKVAFYAEKPLYKLLGPDTSAPATASGLSSRSPYGPMWPFAPEVQLPADIDVVVNPNELVPLDASRPVFLRTPGLDGGEELLGMVAEPRHEARTPAEKLAIEGIAPAPVAGRADQFAAPQLASAAAATRTMDVEKTLNKVTAPSVLPDPAKDKSEPRAVRSDALSRPRPKAPLPAPPAIQPDRLEEVSPPQAAPAAAAAPPPLVTPSTLGKAIVPDAAGGGPLVLSPSRGAPLQAYKRPKSIGAGPNRAPTAVPPPVEDFFTPAEAQEEIPSASNDSGSPDEAAETKPALPDTAPARAPAPSTVPGLADDLAPARGAPGTATPVPVAVLPSKDAPTELLPAAEAPRAPAAPAAPVEAATGVSVAKAVPSMVEPADTGSSAPSAAKSAPAALPEPAQAPVQRAPTVLPASTVRANPAVPAVPSAPGAVETPAQTGQPATPPAPAAPTVLPENGGATASPARKAALPGDPASATRKPAVVQPISADGVATIKIAPAAPADAATPQP